MLIRRGFFLIALIVFIGFANHTTGPVAVHATGAVGVAESASDKRVAHPIAATESPDLTHASKSIRFEPLLLLLLGTALFSIGTAIKLIISRKLQTATARQTKRQSQTVLAPGLHRFSGR